MAHQAPHAASSQARAQLGIPTRVTDGSTKPQSPSQARASSGAGGFGPPPPGTASVAKSPNTPSQPRAIQYRRAVDLFVDPDSVIVAANKRIRVKQDEVSGPWLGAILTQIEAEVRSWGQPPAGMQWAPEVRFRISPGANRTHTRLRNALKRLGMRTTDEFTLQPQSAAAGNIFRQPGPVNRAGATR